MYAVVRPVALGSLGAVSKLGLTMFRLVLGLTTYLPGDGFQRR